MISQEMFLMQYEAEAEYRIEKKKGKWQETIESRHIQADDIDAWE